MEPDRDRTIEKLLGDALRRQGAGSKGPGPQCLDAESAAAWADGARSDPDRRRAEGHVAGGARCQAPVAALARTTPPAPGRASWFRLSRVVWVAPLAAAAAAVIVWAIVPPLARNAAPARAGME